MPTITVDVKDRDLLGLTRLARDLQCTVEDVAAEALAGYVEHRKLVRNLPAQDAEFLTALHERFGTESFTAAQAAEFVMPGVKIPDGSRIIMAGLHLARLSLHLKETGSATQIKRYTMGARRRVYRFDTAA